MGLGVDAGGAYGGPNIMLSTKTLSLYLLCHALIQNEIGIVSGFSQSVTFYNSGRFQWQGLER